MWLVNTGEGSHYLSPLSRHDEVGSSEVIIAPPSHCLTDADAGLAQLGGHRTDDVLINPVTLSYNGKHKLIK